MSFFGGKIGVNIFLKGYILGTSTIAKKKIWKDKWKNMVSSLRVNVCMNVNSLINACTLWIYTDKYNLHLVDDNGIIIYC